MDLRTIETLEAAVRDAESSLRAGGFEAAYRKYAEILASRLALADGSVPAHVALRAADLVVVERLAELAVLFGHFDAADSLLAAMAQLTRRAGNDYGADYATLKRAELRLAAGGLRAAYELLAELEPTIGNVAALELSAGGLRAWEASCRWPNADAEDRAVLFSRLYLVMGKTLAGLGQYRDAAACFERGLAHTEEPDLARRAAVPIRLELAGVSIERGRIADARARLRDLDALVEESPQLAHRVALHELSAKLALLEGDLGRARDGFERAVSLCAGAGFALAAVRAHANLAHALILLNHTSQATRMLRTALGVASRLGARDLGLRIEALLRVADARRHSLADGVPVAESVSRMWQGGGAARGPNDRPESRRFAVPQSDNFLAFFEDRALGVHWQLGRGEPRRAAELLASIREVFESSDSELIATRIEVLEGLVAYYRGEFARASDVLAAVLPYLRDAGLRPEQWQAQRVLGWCWARLGRPAAECDALTRETDALLEDMTASLDARDRAVFLLNKWTADEQFLAAEIERLADLKAGVEAGPWFLRPVRRLRLMREIDGLLARIDRYKDAQARREVSGTAHDGAPAAARLAARLLRTPRRRLTLSFLVLPDRIFVARAGRMSLDFGVSPVTRIELRDEVRRWHEAVRARLEGRGLGAAPGGAGSEPGRESGDPARAESDAASEAKRAADRIAAWLQIPAALEASPGVHELVVVPDDCLHGFPFAAVARADGLLLEQCSLTMSYESAPQRRDRVRWAPDVLAVAVSRGVEGYPPLPGAVREIDRVAASWPAGTAFVRLVDDSATKERVVQALADAWLVHFACHGVFVESAPDRRGMLLSPAPGTAEVLTLRELAAMDLANLRHATLAACWSADNFVVPGRWVVSLPETLVRAGVGSVLGSLWVVHDVVAVAFMQRFYSYLRTDSRAEALRRTQLDCLRRALPGCDGIDTSDELYWAGYTLYGDGARLPLEGP